MGTARPLHKTDVDARLRERVLRLEAALAAERDMRREAELNAKRFHALMLQARIALLPKRTP
jgi:hypothetical protein